MILVHLLDYALKSNNWECSRSVDFYEKRSVSEQTTGRCEDKFDIQLTRKHTYTRRME